MIDFSGKPAKFVLPMRTLEGLDHHITDLPDQDGRLSSAAIAHHHE